MLKTFLNIFKVPELRNKILFTLMLLAIYRIGYHVPLMGVDQKAFEEMKAKQGADQTAAGRLASYVSLFSGGDLSQSTIFGLGVMPYISASIIFQLLGTVVPSLEKMQKEGEQGRKKIQEWTRYAVVPISVVQAIFWVQYMHNAQVPLVQTTWAHSAALWTTAIFTLTAGSIFLMWLGEQIDEYGIGNGISLIIMAGIVSRMPNAIATLHDITWLTPNRPAGKIGPGPLLMLVASFVFIISASILITQAQRRIPVQQAKHTRGRRVYGGSKQYLPLRVNHGGVMPIIFAQSLMIFPGFILGWLNGVLTPTQGERGTIGSIVFWLNQEFTSTGFIYIITELAMIYFFAYFWTTVQFQPKEMANQLRDYGSFVPGLRPGKRTAEYLEKVMMRITFVGAAFLCIIAVIPSFITQNFGVPYQISAFLGGTGLLIVVSVALDMVQRIEANLLMRNYGGFLGGDSKRIKGRQY